MALNSNMLFICSKCYVRVFSPLKTFSQPLLLLSPSRGYRWRPDTHYDVLGVHPEATQVEIKTAYLNLSKELHPDKNQSVTKQDRELIHQRFVKVNQAYSVLGNKRERRTYDLETLMRTDPRWKEGVEKHGGNSGPAHTFGARPMTFEERSKAFGFKPQDPDYYKKHGNYHKKIVIACVAWILGGSLVTWTAIMFLYRRHTTELDFTTKVNNDILMTARSNARMYATVEKQGEAMNKKWVEEKMKFEELMKKS